MPRTAWRRCRPCSAGRVGCWPGPDGLRRAEAGPTGLGRSGDGSANELGPNDIIRFFPNLFLIKSILENLEIVLKARKICGKFKKLKKIPRDRLEHKQPNSSIRSS
jgi:hypothetical protein